MTVTSADAPSTPAAPPRGRPQWSRVARLLASEALTNLLWATGVMLLILAVGAAVARWRGWELVVVTDLDSISAEVTAGADGVRVLWSLFIVVAAVGIAAVVNQVVLACRTRVLLAAGATRRSVALGLLVSAIVMLLYVAAVTVLVTLVVGGGPTGAMSLVGADDSAELARLVVRLGGALAGGLATGTAIAALFLRWPWWVGVGALVVLGAVVPPALTLAWPGLGSAVDGATDWWGADLASAVAMAGLYWLIARRVPVR